MKYQSKAVIIDAQEIVDVGEHVEGAESFALELGNGTSFDLPVKQAGQHIPQKGDFVIFRDDADNYLCPAKVFHEKYMPLPSEGQEIAA